MAVNDKILIAGLFADFERTIARLVLYSLKEMPEPQGVRRTIDILKGTRSSYVVNNDLNQLNTFSSLVGFTRDQLSDILDILINGGFIEVEFDKEDDEDIPLLKITSKGLSYLGSPGKADFVLLDTLLDKDDPQIPEDDQDLYYKLKLARRQLAEEYDLPAFMVCNDSVLRTICIKKPMEPEELEKIEGIDNKFMELYSKQFLYVIRQYITREKSS